VSKPVTKIVTIIKSLTAREIFRRHPGIRREILWGGAYEPGFARGMGMKTTPDFETVSHYGLIFTNTLC